MNQSFPYKKTLLLGFGFFGISLIWPIFNNFVPIFLADLKLPAYVIAFVMTWDNYLNMFLQPVIGGLSDRTKSRFGRRKPWLLIGAPIAAIFFIMIPAFNSVGWIMTAILLTNFGMALFRAPTVAFLGDLFPSSQRSKANGIINLMGGMGAIAAFLVGGKLYEMGRISPFIFGSITLLAAIFVVLIFIKEPPSQKISPEDIRPWAVFHHSFTRKNSDGLYILLAILCWFIGFNAIETWLSSFGKFSLGINEGRMAILTSGLALSFVLFAVPSGLLATKYGRNKIILLGIAGLCIMLSFGFIIHNEAMLILFLIPTGFFWALINVNSLPMLYDIFMDASIGALTGIYYFASNLAAIIGPQIVGFIIHLSHYNYRGMFGFSFVFMILAGYFMSRIKNKALPHDHYARA